MKLSRALVKSLDLSKRSKRRRIMSHVVELLVRLRHAEEAYMDRIPQNMHNGVAYGDAEHSIDCIINATWLLMKSY